MATVDWQALAQDWAAEDSALDARIERVRRAYLNDTLEAFFEAEDKARSAADGDSDSHTDVKQPAGAGPSGAAGPTAPAATAA